MRLIALFLLLAAPFALSAPTTVYKTVDAQGVVSFSDTPPADPGAAEVIAVDAPQPVSAEESRQNLEAMRETTARMAADRREREARREVAREERRAGNAVVTEIRGQPEVRYEYIYLPPQVPFRPWRPGLHPPHRPHLQRPPEGIIRGPNSQLMRPILPRD